MRSSLHSRRSIRASASVLLAALAAMSGRQADAIIVSRFNPQNPNALYNTTAPADDPGWYNVSDNSSAFSSSYIYLGNQWVLTAGHVAANTLRLANGTFNVIPNTDVQLTNPSGSFWQLNSEGQKTFGPLSTNSDLRMFRVNTDSATGQRPEDLNPGIKPITIATAAPAVGANILMMGIGNERVVNLNDVNQQGLYHYNVNTSVNPWTWSGDLNGGGNYHGFRVLNDLNSRTKRWGTNQVSPDSQIEQGWGINDSNNVVVTTTNGGVDVLTLIAEFNQLGTGSNEALASGGDSGGPVFFKDATGQWKLAGIMNSIYLLSEQVASRAIYGDWTAFADLSQPHYYQQIASLRAQTNYSVLGDINLDGVVSGNGSGTWENDDVTAFVQGWLYEQEQANIRSWKKGDLNQDGITDLADFALLREALGGTIGAAQLQALLAGAGVSVVPEPSSMALAWGILSGLWWLLRPRRRWAVARVRRRAT